MKFEVYKYYIFYKKISKKSLKNNFIRSLSANINIIRLFLFNIILLSFRYNIYISKLVFDTLYIYLLEYYYYYFLFYPL